MQWHCGSKILDLTRPLVMGIVNVTPDSFSDGGEHASAAQAIEHARRLLQEGADLVDIGGESTRPGAAPVSWQEELNAFCLWSKRWFVTVLAFPWIRVARKSCGL